MLRHANADQGPEEGGVAIEQSRREVPVLQQILRSVKVFEQKAQKLSPLYDACFDELPLCNRNEQRNDVRAPGRFIPRGSP